MSDSILFSDPPNIVMRVVGPDGCYILHMLLGAMTRDLELREKANI